MWDGVGTLDKKLGCRIGAAGDLILQRTVRSEDYN